MPNIVLQTQKTKVEQPTYSGASEFTHSV